jgi:uroporphyrinogen-III synthase
LAIWFSCLSMSRAYLHSAGSAAARFSLKPGYDRILGGNLHSHLGQKDAFIHRKTNSIEVSSSSRRISFTMQSTSGDAQRPIIALTRELGKNGKLGALLEKRGFQTAEIPCIAFEEGPDAPALPEALGKEQWEYVVITSPEAAGVFLEGWEAAGKPSLTVACVGTATEDSLKRGGINPVFVPSKATGKTLAAELPGPKGNGRVLYPASSRAKTEVQGGLGERGFQVKRLNTYDTVSAVWTQEQQELARKAQVVTLASPSAVKTWAERVGTQQSAACIGETSASACREVGFQKIYWPESPGMDGWVKSVQDAVDALAAARA